jgi:Amt family ammonium transporter
MVHMVWSSNGFLAKLGTLDFAGGTVVHINAGITAFVLSAFLGRRIKQNLTSKHHYNLPWILLGTTILWIGWYGFNAGSAFGLNNVAMQATITTTVSAAASMVAWMILDIIFVKKPQLIGACTGTLCGLVGITPAAGYVTVFGAFVIGICATCVSYLFVNYLKAKIGIDDALDAFGCHGVSGILGSIMTGLFATKDVNASIANNGLFYGGGIKLLGIQLFATLITILFVAILTSIIILFLKMFMPMRVDHKSEVLGLDRTEHGEDADYTVEISDNLDERKRDMYIHSDEFKGQFAQLNSHSHLK